MAVCTSLLEDLVETERRAGVARAEARCADTRTDERFQHLPIACVTTDAQGVILDANPSAAAMLNLSVRCLRDRLLLHFAEDRTGFSHLLKELQRHDDDVRTTVTLRPRERSRRTVAVVIVPESSANPAVWQWYLLPTTGAESEAVALPQWSENGAA